MMTRFMEETSAINGVLNRHRKTHNLESAISKFIHGVPLSLVNILTGDGFDIYVQIRIGGNYLGR